LYPYFHFSGRWCGHFGKTGEALPGQKVKILALSEKIPGIKIIKSQITKHK